MTAATSVRVKSVSVDLLLPVLADGCYHSGEELGEILGVSRTAIWKHLKKLESLGLPLTKVKGKGYCLEGGIELLNRSKIAASMSARAQGLLANLELCQVVDSTNDSLMRQSTIGPSAGYACLAEQQTAGKGRRGRSWVSPFGRNIYLSVCWGFESVAALEGLSLAVGVALARALSAVGVEGVALKWPNDILCGSQKLAGVLIEVSGDLAGSCQVVVGLGVNVSMPAAAAEAIEQPWIDVASLVEGVSRNHLAGAILSELLLLLEGYGEHGFSAYRQEWQSLDAYYGQRVELHTATRSYSGIARGVDDSAALLLELESGLQAFVGGEVSLRASRDPGS